MKSDQKLVSPHYYIEKKFFTQTRSPSSMFPGNRMSKKRTESVIRATREKDVKHVSSSTHSSYSPSVMSRLLAISQVLFSVFIDRDGV